MCFCYKPAYSQVQMAFDGWTEPNYSVVSRIFLAEKLYPPAFFSILINVRGKQKLAHCFFTRVFLRMCHSALSAYTGVPLQIGLFI